MSKECVFMWEFVLWILAGLSAFTVGIVLFDLAFGAPITPFLFVVHSGEMARWTTAMQHPWPDHSQIENSDYHRVIGEDDRWL